MGFSLHLITISAFIVGAFGLPSPAAAPLAVPDFSFEGTSLRNISRSGKTPNYNQNYIAGGASVQYSPSESTGSFTVNFNTKGDFVVGLGWQPGDTTYETLFSTTPYSCPSKANLISILVLLPTLAPSLAQVLHFSPFTAGQKTHLSSTILWKHRLATRK